MTLLAEIEAARPIHGPPCSVHVALTSMSEQDRDDLLAALGDRRFFATTIAGVLRARGFEVGPSAVQRHRSGQCRCSQT